MRSSSLRLAQKTSKLRAAEQTGAPCERPKFNSISKRYRDAAATLPLSRCSWRYNLTRPSGKIHVAVFLFLPCFGRSSEFMADGNGAGAGMPAASENTLTMPSRLPEGKLRQLARERLDDGRLRCEPRGHAWRREGSNLPCSLCDEVIDGRSLEYEVQSHESGGIRVYRFHFFCYALWIEECTSRKGSDPHAPAP
jgi:hypothetical protein